MTHRLFAVYLGGRAPKCNIELHDVVFVTGESIEATYEQLMDKWLGVPDGLHLDSWMELDVVDGHRIRLGSAKDQGSQKLFFVNLGAYKDKEFTEYHANTFLVAESMLEAKARAKATLLQNWSGPVHTDDVHEVDDCLELTEINAHRIHLEKTNEQENLKPTNGYHLVPKDVVRDYIQRKKL